MENVLSVFAMLLVERNMIFISKKYDQLTVCTQALLSLLYPFHWVHAYIPILPTRLFGMLLSNVFFSFFLSFLFLMLGAFQAPFPFIYGIGQSLYEGNKGIIPSQTAKIFLDNNVVDFGSCGPPPRLPEKRFRKLLGQLKQNVPLLLNAERRKETGSAASNNKGKLFA
jgi:hypothetical protein